MYIIWAILAFSVLIIVHELGHFIMAKVNGVAVEEFSIGMGPKIFSHQGKETKYSIGLFPVGGYVKMLGEDEAVEDKRSFSSKKPLAKISIIIAGAFMNLVLAVVIFGIINFRAGFALPEVREVTPNSPAYSAGLKAGDEIKRINGRKVFTDTDIIVYINLGKGEPVDVLVERNGVEKSFTIKPELNEEKRYAIGFYMKSNEDPSIGEAIGQGFKETASTISQTYLGLKMIVTGQANLKTDVGGPVTIIKMSGQAAKAGIWNLLYFTAFISLNLAVFNLLPFPALDGGWTVILLIELITRKKVPDKVVSAVNSIGFLILIGLMILVTLKDIIFPVAL